MLNRRRPETESSSTASSFLPMPHPSLTRTSLIERSAVKSFVYCSSVSLFNIESSKISVSVEIGNFHRISNQIISIAKIRYSRLSIIRRSAKMKKNLIKHTNLMHLNKERNIELSEVKLSN